MSVYPYTANAMNNITHPCGTHCIRLVDDVAGTVGGAQGRIEIQYNGVWGTICDPYWGMRDAEVACRQLGYQYAINATRDAYFGQGTGDIYLALVHCRGNETELAYCPSLPLGDYFYCAHPDDAGVVCSSMSMCFIYKCIFKNNSIHYRYPATFIGR